MARAEFINSILSGKLGGSVFSRNKAGYYVRRWANPTNPQTAGQMRARATLASVASSWHSLTDSAKGAWNSYAVTDFKAKFGNKPGVTYSGFNAFVSNTNVQKNMLDIGVSPIMQVGITATFESLTPTYNAPGGPMSAQIKDDNGANLGLMLQQASLDIASSSMDLIFVFDRPIGGTGPSEVLPVFEDAIGGSKVGIAITGSLPGVQENQAIPNPDFIVLGATSIFDEVTAWLNPASLVFEMALNTQPSENFKMWYQANDKVEFRAYLFNVKGQTQFIGSFIGDVS